LQAGVCCPTANPIPWNLSFGPCGVCLWFSEGKICGPLPLTGPPNAAFSKRNVCFIKRRQPSGGFVEAFFSAKRGGAAVVLCCNRLAGWTLGKAFVPPNLADPAPYAVGSRRTIWTKSKCRAVSHEVVGNRRRVQAPLRGNSAFLAGGGSKSRRSTCLCSERLGQKKPAFISAYATQAPDAGA